MTNKHLVSGQLKNNKNQGSDQTNSNKSGEQKKPVEEKKIPIGCPSKDTLIVPSPAEIYDKLSEYVIGQNEAKKVLSIAANNHYKRLLLHDENVKKANVLLLGPTGCGKTHIVSSLAKVLDVPFTCSSATEYTATGFQGKDVTSILKDLLIKSKGNDKSYNLSAAERGIVFIDEVDKICGHPANNTSGVDIGGFAVQQALLTLIDGGNISVPVTYYDTVVVDTSNILFIFGGAFPEMYNVMRNRLKADGDTAANLYSEDELFERVTIKDLETFGFIPEFIGRIPITVTLRNLAKEDFAKILTEPKDALFTQYTKYFGVDNVGFKYDMSAVERIAAFAVNERRGARGLRTLLEGILSDVMFVTPELSKIGDVDVRLVCGKDDFVEAVFEAPKDKIEMIRNTIKRHDKQDLYINVRERGGKNDYDDLFEEWF